MAGPRPDCLRLPRSRRLQKSREFSRIKAGGARLVCGCLIANWQPAGPGFLSRIGIVTSKRIGNAVIRSRARRLLREAFRLHQCELNQAVELILIARASIKGKPRSEVERDFLRAMRQARLLKEVA